MAILRSEIRPDILEQPCERCKKPVPQSKGPVLSFSGGRFILFCSECFHAEIQKMQNMLADQHTKEIYRRIATRDPGHEHGDFLTSFAQAVLRADPENYAIIRSAALLLVHKYKLNEEGES